MINLKIRYVDVFIYFFFVFFFLLTRAMVGIQSNEGFITSLICHEEEL
jgi:hypothetical protein